MRTLLVFGLMMLFAVVSFVPPNGMKNTSVAEAHDIAKELSIDFSADLNSAVGSVTSHAKTAMKNVDITIPLAIPDAAEVKSAAPSFVKKVFFHAVDIAKEQIDAAPIASTDWKRVAEQEPNEMLRQHFLLIEWAREKSDVRACDELTPTVLEERKDGGKTYQTPLRGDWVAYCLARVTKNSDRCKQIQTTILPPLKSLCEQEFQ